MSDRYRWQALADYNSERARGLVHTPEWVKRMEAEQVEFDADREAQLRSEGWTPVLRDDNTIIAWTRKG